MSYQTEKALLEQITPKTLPRNAAESGLGADLIQEKFYAGIFYLHELLEAARQAYASADSGLQSQITSNLNSINDLITRMVSVESFIGSNAIQQIRAAITALETAMTTANNNISALQTAMTTANTAISTLRNDIVNGIITAYKASRDGDGNVIKTTYATKAELGSTDAEITKIKNGDTVVGKSSKDDEGSIIKSTYVKISNIVNVLTDTSTTKPLSAAQGKALKDALDTLSNYIYNGASNTSIDRLAEVFAFLTNHDDDETLDALLALKVAIADIVNNLTTENASKPLSAKQGKVLKDLVDTKANSSDVYTKSGAEDMVDNKIAGISEVNVITDQDEEKVYDWRIIVRGEKVYLGVDDITETE